MTIYKGDQIIAGGALPSQSGKAGKYLKTDGSNVSWADVQAGGNVDDVKVNGTSVVTNKVANIDLTGKEDVSNKTTTITSSSTNTQYPSAKATFDMGQNIREVAEGKTNSYVVSTLNNPVFDSQEDTIQLTGSFTDINDVVHLVTDLKLGDNFYVVETNVPDRWASNVQGATPVVPEGYTQCEYIESNRTQYIYTGIKENTDWFDTLKTVIDGYYTQEGTANVGGYNNGGQFGQTNSVWSVETVQSVISSNVRRTVTQVLSEITDTDSLYLGDVEIVRRNKGASFWTTDYPLFTAYTGGSTIPSYNPASFRMYSCKMYCDDVLVRNFVPAIRDSDGEIGLWDTVTETFFENGGTEPFTYSVLPDGVTLYKLETAKVPVTDVQINGTTIVNNTVANIPVASQNTSGVVKVESMNADRGVQIVGGILQTVPASDGRLQAKISSYTVVTPANLDKAIREGLGNNSLTWTDAYKASARNTIGASAVSVSATGTATDEVGYITIDGVEKKIAGGGSGSVNWGSIGGTLSNQTDLKNALDAKQDVISDLATIRSGASLGATAVQPGSLATVATTGSYNDLSNKPTIPTVGNGTITIKQGTATKGTFTTNQSGDTTITLDSGSSAHNVGDIFYTLRTDTTLAGAVECNGATYSTTDYSGSGAIGALLAAGKVPYISLSQYATDLAAHGSVRAFGWDGGSSTSFRVPTLSSVFIEAGQAASAGEFISAGLPNITGNTHWIGAVLNNNNTSYANGVFSAFDTNNGAYSGGGGYTNAAGRLSFDASRSSSVYGNSSTVQPNAVKYRAMVQLANGATDEALETCTSVLATVGTHTTQINVLNAHRVIEFQKPTASNNYTWYRKYADGWLEQGGYITGGGAGLSVTLPIEMSNVNYHIGLTGFLSSATAGSTTSVSKNAGAITTTGFHVNNFVENGSTKGNGTAFWWTVSGVAA